MTAIITIIIIIEEEKSDLVHMLKLKFKKH